MPRCKNIPPGGKACYYKGDEPSPRGRGYTAKYCEGDSKKGTDGQMYLAKGGRWIKKNSRKTSPRGFNPEYQRRYNRIKNILSIVEFRHDDIGEYNIDRLMELSENRLICIAENMIVRNMVFKQAVKVVC